MSDSFDATRWSIIERARGDEQSERREALQTLLTTYMPALRSHLVRRKRLSPELADEMLQGFLVKNVVEGKLIERADASAGKFRSWLLKWLENYVRHEFGRTKREMTLDEFPEEDSAGQETDLFDVEWARSTLADALELMQSECRAEGHEVRWHVFQKRLLHPLLDATPPMEYDILVEQLDLDSKAQAQNLLVSAKRHFQRSLEAVVSRYADSDEDVAIEIRDLHRVLVASRLDTPSREIQDEQGTMLLPAAMKRIIDASPENLATLLQLDVKAIWTRCLDTRIDRLLDETDTEDTPTGIKFASYLQLPHPSEIILGRMKRLGNSYIQQESKEFPVDVGLAIYLTAIAVGQVRLGKWISNANVETLRPGFEYLRDSGWLDVATLAIHEDALRQQLG